MAEREENSKTDGSGDDFLSLLCRLLKKSQIMRKMQSHSDWIFKILLLL